MKWGFLSGLFLSQEREVVPCFFLLLSLATTFFLILFVALSRSKQYGGGIPPRFLPLLHVTTPTSWQVYTSSPAWDNSM